MKILCVGVGGDCPVGMRRLWVDPWGGWEWKGDDPWGWV